MKAPSRKLKKSCPSYSDHENKSSLVMSKKQEYVDDDNELLSKKFSIKEDFGEISFKEEVSEEFLHRETNSSLTFDIPCAKSETYLPHSTIEVLQQDFHQDKEMNLPCPRNLKVISQTSCLSSRLRVHKSEQNLSTSVNSKSRSQEKCPNISSIPPQSTQANSQSLCTYQAAAKNYLKKKLHTHTGEKPFKCSLCPYQAARKDNLKKHLYKHSGEKPFKCSLCPYQTARKDHLKIHLCKHSGEKPFKCSFCPFQTTTNTYLKSHLHTHTGEKPFKCDLCTYQAARKYHIKNHLHTHTGEKPFKCSLCPFQAGRKNYLKVHLYTHTGEKPFKCQICPYQTSNKTYLKNHLYTHTVEKSLECSFCPYKATNNRALKMHLSLSRCNKGS